MTHHHSIHYYCKISITAALLNCWACFRVPGSNISTSWRYFIFFFPLLCSPCVIPVLGLAQRPGRWFSASEWETPFHTLFSLKNPVINTAWTASSSCVGVPLTLQTCLDSRIPDQLITHAFLSLPRRTYQGVNRHVRRRQHFYHEKKRVGEKKTQTNVFTTQTLVYVVWQVGFINSTI